MDVSFLGDPIDENNFLMRDVIKLGKGFSVRTSNPECPESTIDRYVIKTDLRRLQVFDPDVDEVENYVIEKFDLSESTNKATSILVVRNDDHGIDYRLFEFDWENNKIKETLWPLQT